MNNNQDALQAIILRNSFYQRLYYLALSAIALSIIIIGLLIAQIVYLLQHPVRPLYFATDDLSRLIKVVPVGRPSMTTQQIIAWAKEGVVAAYTYDYMNFRSQLQSAQKFFTSYGWREYMKGLTDSNNLIALTERKLIASAKVVGEPKIINEGLLKNGLYAWEMEMPVLVTFWGPPYDDKSYRVNNPYMVTVLIQRQPALQSYKGLGIVQLIARYVATIPTQ